MTALHCLWVGGRLRWMERLCLLSMRATGWPVVLWHYFPVEGVPDGIALRDGRDPRSWIAAQCRAHALDIAAP